MRPASTERVRYEHFLPLMIMDSGRQKETDRQRGRQAGRQKRRQTEADREGCREEHCEAG
eukprot:2502215-Rhodomonas_salina.3